MELSHYEAACYQGAEGEYQTLVSYKTLVLQSRWTCVRWCDIRPKVTPLKVFHFYVVRYAATSGQFVEKNILPIGPVACSMYW